MAHDLEKASWGNTHRFTKMMAEQAKGYRTQYDRLRHAYMFVTIDTKVYIKCLPYTGH